MHRYKVQLKQGKLVKSVNVESTSVVKVLAFFNLFCTMEVTEICEIVYNPPNELTIPMDDFNYHSVVKTFAKNKDVGISKEYLFNNIKKTVNEQELFIAMQEYFTIDGFHIDSIYATIFKMS